MYLLLSISVPGVALLQHLGVIVYVDASCHELLVDVIESKIQNTTFIPIFERLLSFRSAVLTL